MARLGFRLEARNKCRICGFKSPYISRSIGVCLRCIRDRPDEALEIAMESHRRARRVFGLEPDPPRASKGVRCTICAAECIIPEGSSGYCGVRANRGGRMVYLPGEDRAYLYYYLDPHITNCCNAWFCPGGTGCGFPKYSYSRGPEEGYYNLALFFYGCSFNCLFCQNWSHKEIYRAKAVHVEEIVDLTLRNERISCWCWFGGSAEPQLPFAIKASRLILERKPRDRIVRICYEWNGDGNPWLVRRAMEHVVESGGNVKFDLKAYDPVLHRVLTGMDNRRVLENFELVYREFYDRRREVPVLGATTLLIPHYIDEHEVSSIAEFISSLDDSIPYNLLVFHPDFMMNDIPVTPKDQVFRCYRAAKRYLRNVNISNLHLLGFTRSSLAWGPLRSPA